MEVIIGVALWALIPGFVAKKKGRSFWGYYLLSFLISPLITTVITLCLKTISREQDDSNSNYSIETPAVTDNPQTTSDSQETDALMPALLSSNLSLENSPSGEFVDQDSTFRKIQFCRRCGFKLIDGSKFCSLCGNKIESDITTK